MSLAIDDQVCFPLYAASRALTAAYRPLLAPLGLTYPQYLVMLVLWERGTLPVKDIGRELRLDSGTLSPLLKRLEASGFITRRRRPEDERSVEVRLTDEGRALRTAAEDVPERLAASSGVDPETFTQLKHLCETLLDTTTEDAPR